MIQAASSLVDDPFHCRVTLPCGQGGGAAVHDKTTVYLMTVSQVCGGQIEMVVDLAERVTLIDPAMHIVSDLCLLLVVQQDALEAFFHDAVGIGITQFGQFGTHISWESSLQFSQLDGRCGVGHIIGGHWWLPCCRFCNGGPLLYLLAGGRFRNNFADVSNMVWLRLGNDLFGGQGELHRLTVDHVEDDLAGGDKVVTAQACLGAALALPTGVEDHHG